MIGGLHGRAFLQRELARPINGARDRNRTGTGLPPRDFKSLASTNFATRAVESLRFYPTVG